MQNSESEPVLRTALFALHGRCAVGRQRRKYPHLEKRVRFVSGLLYRSGCPGSIAFAQAKPSPQELAIVIVGQAVGVTGIERFGAKIGETYWNRGLVTKFRRP